MRDRPRGIDDSDIADALRRAWDVEAVELTYAPKGAGSYHWTVQVPDDRRYFVTVDDLDSKPWLGADRPSTFDGLRAAFDTAVALRHDQGRRFVVAPITSVDGASLVRLSSQYSIAMFPFVDGQIGEFGDGLAPVDRTRLVALLADLHGARHDSLPIRRQGVELAGRAKLELAVREVDRPWDTNPFAERTRALVAAHAELVSDWLATLDSLAVQVAERDNELVVTHGEPHAANLMYVDDDASLIDWDTVGLAVPERDLWMLDGDQPDALVLYSEMTGRPVDRDATALYRLTWTLADLAAYIPVLRSSPNATADVEKAWAAVTTYLD